MSLSVGGANIVRDCEDRSITQDAVLLFFVIVFPLFL